VTPPPRPSDRAGPERAQRTFHTLAAAVAHALRTPLSALSGELELALHRERTAEAYRDALRRIADRVTELDELTADLASFGSEVGPIGSGTAGLDELLAPLASADVDVEPPSPPARVTGDPQRLTRALTLLVQHATRHRADGGRVRVRADVPPDDDAGIDVWVDVSPSRFPGRTWIHLEPVADGAEPVNTAGLFRLTTAAHLVGQCGGAIDVACRDGSDAVRISLRRGDTNRH